jgi:hypothetical protein
MNNTTGDGHHGALAQFDENGNTINGWVGASHNHQHTWNYNSHTHTIPPTADWIGGSSPTDYTSFNIGPNFMNNDVQFWANDIMVNNKNLTRAVEDMALLLKMIVDKYDLHEVKKLVDDTEIAIWAQDGKYNVKDIVEEKKEHLDEKLFEI